MLPSLSIAVGVTVDALRYRICSVVGEPLVCKCCKAAFKPKEHCRPDGINGFGSAVRVGFEVDTAAKIVLVPDSELPMVLSDKCEPVSVCPTQLGH